MASLAERSASPWTATSMRDRPAGAPASFAINVRINCNERRLWSVTEIITPCNVDPLRDGEAATGYQKWPVPQRMA